MNMGNSIIDFNEKKGFICDMDGVIYHGNQILPGVPEFIQWLHDEKKEYLFLTNNKLAKEIGGAKAAKELGIPEGTIHTWLKAVRAGKLDVGEGSHTPASAMSLSEEITMLRKRVKEQDKEIRRLKEENEFLEEASAFFAASRRKSAKTRE